MNQIWNRSTAVLLWTCIFENCQVRFQIYLLGFSKVWPEQYLQDLNKFRSVHTFPYNAWCVGHNIMHNITRNITRQKRGMHDKWTQTDRSVRKRDWTHVERYYIDRRRNISFWFRCFVCYEIIKSANRSKFFTFCPSVYEWKGILRNYPIP